MVEAEEARQTPFRAPLTPEVGVWDQISATNIEEYLPMPNFFDTHIDFYILDSYKINWDSLQNIVH